MTGLRVIPTQRHEHVHTQKGGNARIDKARTDKDHILIITYLNIDQLKLEIRTFDKRKKKRNKHRRDSA